MSTLTDVEARRAVEQLIYREARLADEHAYDAWEALWTDDAVYCVPAHPAGGPDSDPTRQVSVIFDNRARIATRIKQFHTGKRYAQTPASSLRRIVSNVELVGEDDGDVLATANFMLAEARERGTQFWAGRYEYRLRHTDDGLKMARKTVVLVDADRALSTMAFLI